MDRDSENSKPDLRPVVASLREIERKCASLASRNEEFPLMQDRVAGIISRLEAGQEPDGGALDYRRIGRELFPVAHLFESTGFMSVGKEITHVERLLADLAPRDPDAQPPPPPSPRFVSSTAAKKTVVEPVAAEPEEAPESRSVPVPVAVAFLLLVVAVAVSAAIILGIGPFARLLPPNAARQPAVAVEPTPPPTQPVATPTVLPTPKPRVPPTAIPRGLLAQEIAAARLALAKGDLEAAADHLSEAARIHRTEPDLKQIAEQVVRGFVGWADDAARRAEWDRAEPHLERAERIAMRFGVDTSQIEETRTRIAAMVRFVIVGPGESQVIQRSIGRKVDIELTDGTTRSGRIEAMRGGTLVLVMDNQVGGGTVRFTEEIPASSIRSLKIYED